MKPWFVFILALAAVPLFSSPVNADECSAHLEKIFRGEGDAATFERWQRCRMRELSQGDRVEKADGQATPPGYKGSLSFLAPVEDGEVLDIPMRGGPATGACYREWHEGCLTWWDRNMKGPVNAVVNSVAENIAGTAIAALLLFWLFVPYEPWLRPRVKRFHDDLLGGDERSSRAIEKLYGWLTGASALAGLVFWHSAVLIPLVVFFHLWTAMASENERASRPSPYIAD